MSDKILKDEIDCVLLKAGNQSFLLPANALCAVVSLHGFQPNTQPPLIGSQLWGKFSIPIVTMGFAVNINDLHFPKIAIINQLPYYGLLFEKNPQQLRLTDESMTWIDEDKKVAKLMMGKEEFQEVIIPDLDAISNAVKNLTLS